MTTFYILNNAPTIDATSAAEAARLYALQQGIVGGAITLAITTKVCDVTSTPRDVTAIER